MEHFVNGILEKNVDGAIYRDSVFDKILVINSGGITLDIYDSSFPISADLIVGKTYELLLNPTIFESLQYSGDQTHNEVLRGVVIDVHWSASRDSCQLFKPGLYETRNGSQREWVLVETVVGNMLMSSDEIYDETHRRAKPGDVLYWKHARFDLYGVIMT